MLRTSIALRVATGTLTALAVVTGAPVTLVIALVALTAVAATPAHPALEPRVLAAFIIAMLENFVYGFVAVTLIQRSAPQEVAARVFGLYDTVAVPCRADIPDCTGSRLAAICFSVAPPYPHQNSVYPRTVRAVISTEGVDVVQGSRCRRRVACQR